MKKNKNKRIHLKVISGHIQNLPAVWRCVCMRCLSQQTTFSEMNNFPLNALYSTSQSTDRAFRFVFIKKRKLGFSAKLNCLPIGRCPARADDRTELWRHRANRQRARVCVRDHNVSISKIGMEMGGETKIPTCPIWFGCRLSCAWKLKCSENLTWERHINKREKKASIERRLAATNADHHRHANCIRNHKQDRCVYIFTHSYSELLTTMPQQMPDTDNLLRISWRRSFYKLWCCNLYGYIYFYLCSVRCRSVVYPNKSSATANKCDYILVKWVLPAKSLSSPRKRIDSFTCDENDFRPVPWSSWTIWIWTSWIWNDWQHGNSHINHVLVPTSCWPAMAL